MTPPVVYFIFREHSATKGRRVQVLPQNRLRTFREWFLDLKSDGSGTATQSVLTETFRETSDLAYYMPPLPRALLSDAIGLRTAELPALTNTRARLSSTPRYARAASFGAPPASPGAAGGHGGWPRLSEEGDDLPSETADSEQGSSPDVPAHHNKQPACARARRPPPLQVDTEREGSFARASLPTAPVRSVSFGATPGLEPYSMPYSGAAGRIQPLTGP